MIPKLIIKRTNFAKIAITILFAGLIACTTQTPEKKIRLLTVGNSFTSNACTYLEEITRSVPNCEISIRKANIGGCSLEKHSNLITACEKDSTLKPYNEKYSLKEIVSLDTFDIITIQQVSHLSFKPETYQPYVDSIYNFLHEYAPTATIMVHQTWAYSPLCNRLARWNISRAEMHVGLVRAYDELARNYALKIIPSGDAFNYSYLADSSIYLWKEGDFYHANEAGKYLAGCVWFGILFDVSPLEITFVPEGLNLEVAAFLRKIAGKTIVSGR